MAAGLGLCAIDASGEFVPAEGSPSCWESARASRSPAMSGLDGGLFGETEPAPLPMQNEPTVRTMPELRTAPDQLLRTAPRRTERLAKPPLEEPRRAAWVEPGEDRLVDAPVVEPSDAISTEAQRRRRRWFL